MFLFEREKSFSQRITQILSFQAIIHAKTPPARIGLWDRFLTRHRAYVCKIIVFQPKTCVVGAFRQFEELEWSLVTIFDMFSCIYILKTLKIWFLDPPKSDFAHTCMGEIVSLRGVVSFPVHFLLFGKLSRVIAIDFNPLNLVPVFCCHPKS